MLAHRADNELLFSQRRCLVLTVDLTALALIGFRDEQDFPALFCFNCCSSELLTVTVREMETSVDVSPLPSAERGEPGAFCGP